MVVRATANQAGDELPLADVKPCLDGAGVAGLQQLAARSGSTSRSSTTPCASCGRRATRPASRSAAARAARSRWCAARAPWRCSTAATIVTPDDIKRVALPALRHRVALAPDALLEGRTANDLLADVIDDHRRAAHVAQADELRAQVMPTEPKPTWQQ